MLRNYFSKVARSEPAKPARKQNLMRNSHSRSCILGSLKSWWRTAYRYIIMLASSLKFRKTLKIAVLENPTVVWCHLPRKPQRIHAYHQKLQSLAYISDADSMGLSSFKFLWWAPKDASFLQQSAYWPFNVVDFGTNRKGIWDFLLVTNSNFGPILHHFWDMVIYWLKIANFSYPTLI